TIFTTILFGVAPAIRASCVDAGESLKSGSRSGMAPERAFAQRILVIGEVALCLVLLAGAGLMFKSFRRVLDVNPGFRAENLVTMRAQLPDSFKTAAAVTAFYRRLNERIAAVPGVASETITERLPITGGEGNGDITIEGRATADGELGASTFRRVAPNYFSVLEIPLLRGRVFDDRDDGSREQVTIINESFARRFWPNEDPIGQRIKIGPRDSASFMRIVGVVGDVHQISLDSDAPFSTYEPILERPVLRLDIAARTAGDPSAVIASIRRELHGLEPNLLIDHEQSMTQRIDDNVAPRRLNLVLFGLFASLALLLAAIGLYGVAAYAAGQRTQEFGIRMALGAQRGDVLRLVLGQGIRLALMGVAIGLAASLALSRLMTGLLFDVQPADPSTLAAVAILLSIAMLAACWLPAYRATRIAPVEALRAE
ncbi:MAG TPA: FtsX-like permease family protein, partial [Bryobacteraceae bacterium]|nr:FtsX-like permease family protein [Bryobacteraceae bacterium]